MATRENKSLSAFKSRLVGGGARPNLFEVELTTFPDAVEGWDNNAADVFRFMCKSAALPASNIAAPSGPSRHSRFPRLGSRWPA